MDICFFVILLAGMGETQTHDLVLTNQLAHGEKTRMCLSLKFGR